MASREALASAASSKVIEMLSNSAKRGISFAVFGLGMFGGLWACGASMRGIFTLGARDTLPEILAILLGLVTPMWACFAAMW